MSYGVYAYTKRGRGERFVRTDKMQYRTRDRLDGYKSKIQGAYYGVVKCLYTIAMVYPFMLYSKHVNLLINILCTFCITELS